MKLRSFLMFLGCLIGGFAGIVYWYVTSGSSEMSSNLSSVVLYGVFIGLFFADLLTQGIIKQTE